MKETGKAYRLRSDVRYRNIGGEGVLLCQQSAGVVGVNGLGIRIVELIDADGELRRVRETLLQEYDVSAEELCGDIDRYVHDLVEAGVLEPVSRMDGAD